ncbi:MAG: PaaI family thioesterase [Natronomonas sp.]
MGVLEYFNESPYRKLLGIEIVEATDGHAEGRLELDQKHSSSTKRVIAQGGVTFSLADSVGGAAAVSLQGQPTPTIDFRIDYLEPATNDLRATAEVRRYGEETSVVDVLVTDATGTDVAVGRGVYKTNDPPADGPWEIEQA